LTDFFLEINWRKLAEIGRNLLRHGQFEYGRKVSNHKNWPKQIWQKSIHEKWGRAGVVSLFKKPTNRVALVSLVLTAALPTVTSLNLQKCVHT
jgi:hypothetical protein